MRSDRVLNFEFMSGDRTFKLQTNRTFSSQSNRTVKNQNDHSLKFNQQDDGDRTFSSPKQRSRF